MKTSTLTWVIVVIIIVLGLGWWWVARAPAPAPVDQAQNITEAGNTPDTSAGPGVNTGVSVSVSAAPMSAAVTYGPNGFSSQEVTIKKGGTVTWANQGGGPMVVASAVHPTHSVYDGTSRSVHCTGGPNTTSFDQCAEGSSYQFTFTKAGTWAYHNHVNASHFGRVIVVE